LESGDEGSTASVVLGARDLVVSFVFEVEVLLGRL
jgi:hypothetical protein